MAAARTGTASEVGALTNNSSASVTVPADATGVCVHEGHWDTDSAKTLASVTLNGVAFTLGTEVANVTGSPFNQGASVWYLVNPATGTQTLAWDWDGADDLGEGGMLMAVYVNGINTADPVRDSDAAGFASTTDASLTLTTEATDLVIAAVEQFGDTNPALAGTVFINNTAYNNDLMDASEIAAGSPSTSITMTGESYAGLSAIAWKAAVAGGVVGRLIAGKLLRGGILSGRLAR